MGRQTETQTNEERELAENAQQAEAQIAGLGMLGALLNNPWNQERAANYYRANGYGEPAQNADGLTEQLSDRENEGVLSIEVERTVRIVLCTGGPHCEVRWPERSDPSIVCYGWFGAGKFERQLTHNEQTGLEAALGDWETLAENA